MGRVARDVHGLSRGGIWLSVLDPRGGEACSRLHLQAVEGVLPSAVEGGGGGGGGGVGLAGASKTYVFEDHGVLGTRPVVVTYGRYRLAGRGGRSLGRVGLAILIG